MKLRTVFENLRYMLFPPIISDFYQIAASRAQMYGMCGTNLVHRDFSIYVVSGCPLCAKMTYKKAHFNFEIFKMFNETFAN